MLNSTKIRDYSKIFFITLAIVLVLVILDQYSKKWLIENLKKQPGWVFEVTDFLEIAYVWNYGISFGLFRSYYQYSNMVFILLNSLIVLYLYYLIFKHRSSAIKYIGFSFVIGGALGNLMDRIYRQAVFDFIHLHYNEYSFPVFNLADSFISIGAFLLIVAFARQSEESLL